MKELMSRRSSCSPTRSFGRETCHGGVPTDATWQAAHNSVVKDTTFPSPTANIYLLWPYGQRSANRFSNRGMISGNSVFNIANGSELEKA